MSYAERYASEDKEERVRKRLLDASMDYVPELGWSVEALAEGAKSQGYPATAHGMFPRGGIELVLHHVHSSNAAVAPSLEDNGVDLAALSQKERLFEALKARLKQNEPFLDQWPEGMVET